MSRSPTKIWNKLLLELGQLAEFWLRSLRRYLCAAFESEFKQKLNVFMTPFKPVGTGYYSAHAR